MARDYENDEWSGPHRILSIQNFDNRYPFVVWVETDECYGEFIEARHCTPEELAPPAPPAPPAPKMRPMTRCECMQWAAWANEQARLGVEFWVVDIGSSKPCETDEGYSLYFFEFTDSTTYWRARLDPATGMPVKWEKMEVEE